MKHNIDIGIIGIAFCSEPKFKRFKERLKEEGINIRELKIFNLGLKRDKFDEQVNFLKHFTWRQYWVDRVPLYNPSFIEKTILKALEKQTLKLINLKESEEWERDTSHQLHGVNFLPLFYQEQSYECETEDEKEIFDKLRTFSSKGYEAKIKKVAPEDKTFKGSDEK